MIRNFAGGSQIKAHEITLGKDFQIGADVRINVRGHFYVGDYSRFGDDVQINAENAGFGDHFFHLTPGLRIGGGGSQFPSACFYAGDRVVLHNNKINLARGVTLGNDVGLSPDVDIVTHGFWKNSILGYPCAYGGVGIGDGTIIGQRSMILMGVNIAKDVVVGAQSVVTRSLTYERGIYAGSPAKFIRLIEEPSLEEKIKTFSDIVDAYKKLATEHVRINSEFPLVEINDAILDLVAQTISGKEDDDTDRFRDFIRRYGVRIYTSRGFKSLL